LSRTAVHDWVEKFSQGRSIVADDARSFAEVAETRIKRFIYFESRSTGKAMGQVSMSMEGVSRNKCFFGFEYHMFYVLYLFLTCSLTLLRILFNYSSLSSFMKARSSIRGRLTLTANILIKKLRTIDNGWSSSLWEGRRVNTSLP
jgi:hypothetical protein